MKLIRLPIQQASNWSNHTPFAGEVLSPDTRIAWRCEVPQGVWTLQLEMSCQRHFKGGVFEVRAGSRLKRHQVPRTESFEDFAWFDLGGFEFEGGAGEIELRVLACGDRFARIKGLRLLPGFAARPRIEFVGLQDCDTGKVRVPPELWARDFIGSSDKDFEVLIRTASTYQTIAGVGGTFNEQGGECLFSLPSGRREAIVEALFGEGGASFSFCCVPIGASDFALAPYSWNDAEGDFAMERLDSSRDEAHLMRYIREARKVRPNLKLHARPWSPPAWMKTTGSMNTGSLKHEPEVLEAYALYLCRVVERLAELGVPLERLVVQNEPDVAGGYAGCIFRPEDYARFVVEFLEPMASKRKIPAELWAGSFQGIWKPTAQRVMSQPGMLEAVRGVAFQYNLIQNVLDFRLLHPGVRIMHSESPCFSGGNTWTEACALFQDALNYLNAGADCYTYWNMILDGPARSYAGWRQNSLWNIDRSTGEARSNPDFEVMRLLGRGIQPGAVRIEAFALGRTVCAVKNTDGSVVLFVDNPSARQVLMDVTLDDTIHQIALQPNSLCSVRFANDHV